MKSLKKLLPGLLCALAICVCLPFRAEAAGGSCGTNATWSLNETTGVLTISGTGAMNNYAKYGDRPWHAYRSTTTRIVVSEGITHIGNHAFNSCAATSVSLPSTLKSIGKLAFYKSKATSLTIPAGVTTIGEDALDSMSNLTAIHVAEGNLYYSSRDGVLYKGTTLVMCPRNSPHTSFVVPEDITYIGEKALYNCLNLTSVTLHDGLERIGASAFAGSGLTEITIPAELEYLGSQAFDYCSNLKTITFLNRTKLTVGWTGTSSAGTPGVNGLPAKVTIRAYDCAGYTVWYTTGSGSWKDYATKYSTSSTTLVYESLGHAGGKLKNGGTWLIDGKGVLTVTAKGAVTDDPWEYYANMVMKAVVSEGITAIPSFSGYSYSQMTQVSLPSTLQSLPDYAFCNCTALKAITVPDSVTVLGEECFYECGELTSVTLPEGITAIPDYTFYHCRKLTSVNIPTTVTSIGDYAFWACLSLPAVNLPAGLQSIGAEGFSNCAAFTSVTLPAALTDLGEKAFVCCTDLQAISVEGGNPNFAAADGILYTKDGKTLICYPDGKAGTEFTLPETVITIAPYACYYNRNLTSLTLHSGIQTVGASAACCAEKLTDVYYDGTREEWSAVAVGDRAFDDGVTVHFGLACKTAGTQLVGYVEATCTAAGYTGDTVCTGCGAVVTKGKTVTSSGHYKVWHSPKSPTCTSVGWDGYYTCKNCDYTEYYKERPMLDHSITHTLQAATCTEPGQEYWQCSSCKQYFTDADGTAVGEITVLPSPGHSWSAWSTVTAATWLEAGAESRSCTACGETETNVLPATGQTVVDGITVTVTEGGLTLENVPQGLTVMLSAYSGGRQVSVQLGTTAFTLPGEGYSFLLFFVDSAWRPIGTAKPIK